MAVCNIYTLGLALFGLIVLVQFLLSSLWGFIQAVRYFLAPYFIAGEEDLSLGKRYGNWALVTGCTDGLGKAYSLELAKRGLNIVLVSRNEKKLKDTAQEIEAKYPVKTKIITADFANGSEAIEIIKKGIASIPIGILVNNVGKNYEYPKYLDETNEKELWDIITINVGAVTLMSRYIIEDMKKRGRGAIVNVSSGSELQPLPLMTVYAATKSYIKSFTMALRWELQGTGLTVQHLAPFYVDTNMNKFSERMQNNRLVVPDAESWANYAAKTLGKMDFSTGYWSHEVQYFCTSMIPTWLRVHIGGMLNVKFREEYLQKQK